MSQSDEIVFGNASYGFREYSLREFFDASKQIDISAVEIDAGWLVGESRNAIALDASPGDIAAVQEEAAEAGVRVAVLGAGAVVALYGEEVRDNSAEIMQAIDLAAALDARVIRVFTEHDFNHSKHYVLPAERVTDALYDSLGAAFNKVGKYAQEKNVLVGIENHGGTSATGAGLKKLLDRVPYKAVGVTYDPANYAIGGEDPYQALLQFQERVVYTHWKDITATEKGYGYCTFGEGEIDWPPIVSALLDSFDGLWSIEFERKVNSPIETLMAGTQAGMQNLQAILSQVGDNR